MQPMLQIESRQGSAVAEFFDDGRNHHRVEAHRVARDDEKCKLPSQAGAEESVVEAGVRDGWGIVARGVRVRRPQMPAIQKIVLANFMG